MSENEAQSMYVSKHYVMDPVLDEMLFDGTELKVGMIVLIGDSHARQDPYYLSEPGTDQAKDYLIDALSTVNRWCEVTQVRANDAPGFGQVVSFMGLYSDGTLRKRTYAIEYPWIVRKDSIPTTDTEQTNLRSVS